MLINLIGNRCLQRQVVPSRATTGKSFGRGTGAIFFIPIASILAGCATGGGIAGFPGSSVDVNYGLNTASVSGEKVRGRVVPAAAFSPAQQAMAANINATCQTSSRRPPIPWDSTPTNQAVWGAALANPDGTYEGNLGQGAAMLDGPAETVKLNDRRRVIAANAVLQSYVDCVQGHAGAFVASVKFENQTQFAEPPRITVGGSQTTSQTRSVTTNADGSSTTTHTTTTYSTPGYAPGVYTPGVPGGPPAIQP